MALGFCKMHGAGNDFVLIDRRDAPRPLPPAQVRQLCDRHRGIGCDQLLTIEAPRSAAAVLAYGIWNRDGSRAGQCGNGARCVAAWARRAGLVSDGDWVFDSPSGPVDVCLGEGPICIGMGVPQFDAAAVGFVDDDRPRQLALGDRSLPFALVSMGNPHAVLVVDNVAEVPLADWGGALQNDPRFADGCNVGVAEVVDRGHIRLRVFERGAAETLACGSGACAAVAVLRRAGRLDAEVAVDLPGGRLQIAWPGEGAPLRMAGPAEFVFEGVIDL
jgi:diaminopimelate epimerase